MPLHFDAASASVAELLARSNQGNVYLADLQQKKNSVDPGLYGINSSNSPTLSHHLRHVKHSQFDHDF